MRCSQDPLLRFNNLLIKQLAKPKETCTYVYWFAIKDVIKDTDEQLEEEGHRVRSRRVLSSGASVPVELEWEMLPAHGCVHQPGGSLESCYLGIFMETSLCRHDGY